MPVATLEQQQQQRRAPAPSCTPHSPKRRYHVQYEDFFMVCSYDVCNAAALRVFEMRTNARIAHLRKYYSIPRDALPSEDDLWFSQSLRDMETSTLYVYGKSSYGPAIRELMELGFIKKRWIARPGYGAATPATSLYEDEDGDFIVVDGAGYYTAFDGTRHSAYDEGYIVERDAQYLLCVEAVNAAIADLDGEPPPKPLPRWKPVTVFRRGERRGDCNGKGDDNHTITEAVKNKNHAMEAEGYSVPNHRDVLFTNENNTSLPVLSIAPSGDASAQSSVALRTALWTPETLIGLASHLLRIPDRATVDDPDAWDRDWGEPAQRLIAHTSEYEPARAWERIDLTMRYMATPGSPSWWQRPAKEGGRKTKAPVTLKNVADRFEIEYYDLGQHRNQWWPKETTPYDGPAWEGDDQAQAITAQAAQAPIIVDAEITELAQDDEVRTEPTTGPLRSVALPRTQGVVRHPAGMPLADAQALRDEIHAAMPELLIEGLRPVRGGGWGVGVIASATHGITITHPQQWYADDGKYPGVDQAIRYALYGDAPPQPEEECGEDDVGQKADDDDRRAPGLPGEIYTPCDAEV